MIREIMPNEKAKKDDTLDAWFGIDAEVLGKQAQCVGGNVMKKSRYVAKLKEWTNIALSSGKSMAVFPQWELFDTSRCGIYPSTSKVPASDAKLQWGRPVTQLQVSEDIFIAIKKFNGSDIPAEKEVASVGCSGVGADRTGAYRMVCDRECSLAYR